MKTSLLLACAIATTSLSPTPKIPSWDDYEKSRRLSMVFGFEYSPENYPSVKVSSEDWIVDNSSTYDSFTLGAGVTFPPNTSPEDSSWQNDYFGSETTTTTTTTITTTATTTTTTTTTFPSNLSSDYYGIWVGNN